MLRLAAWYAHGPSTQAHILGASLHQRPGSDPVPPSVCSPPALHKVSMLLLLLSPTSGSEGLRVASTTAVGMSGSGQDGWRQSLLGCLAGKLPCGAWAVPGWRVLCCRTSPRGQVCFSILSCCCSPCHCELLFLGDCSPACPSVSWWMCFSI